jgi:hypothetical protein
VIHQSGLEITSDVEAGTYRVVARFPGPGSETTPRAPVA